MIHTWYLCIIELTFLHLLFDLSPLWSSNYRFSCIFEPKCNGFIKNLPHLHMKPYFFLTHKPIWYINIDRGWAFEEKITEVDSILSVFGAHLPHKGAKTAYFNGFFNF